MASVIKIEKLSHSTETVVHRVSAEVEGAPLWFESSDVPLCPAPEGFTSALLVPALEQGADVVIDEPLSPIWLSNARSLMAIFRRWWGYPEIAIESARGGLAPVQEGTGTALCFSGGVDSFFSLLRGTHRVDYVVFAHGYDVPLADTARMRLFQSPLRSIAERTGTKPVIIKTNLREHPSFARASWERSHGGALAALGHVMGGVRRLVISSTCGYGYVEPWGSHWETDRLWSSGRLEVLYEGASYHRNEKLRLLADEPLVREFLRVCWEHRNARLNCCRCEKCVRTMLVLAQCRKLDEFTAFEERDRLAEDLDQFPPPRDFFVPAYRDLLDRGLPPELARPVQDLLSRSRMSRMLSRPFIGGVLRRIRPYVPVALRKKLKRPFKLQ